MIDFSIIEQKPSGSLYISENLECEEFVINKKQVVNGIRTNRLQWTKKGYEWVVGMFHEPHGKSFAELKLEIEEMNNEK